MRPTPAVLCLSLVLVSTLFAPGGTGVASSGAGSIEKVWSFTREGSEATIWKLAWSPDGSMIASSFFDSAVIVLDARTGTVVKELDLSTPRTRCDGFSPPGTTPVRAVAFSGDGKYLAAAGDDLLVHVFSVPDWTEKYTFKGHTGSVLCLDFSPDSKYLASGSGTDKVIPQNAGENVTRIWDLSTGEETLVLRGHRDGVLAVEWSEKGDRIATVSDDRTVRVWSFPAGGLLVNVTGHTSGVLDVDWSPDGSRLITGSRDYKIKVWNSTTGEQIATWPDYNCVRSVDYHPDGTLVATSGVDLTLKLRDPASGTALKVVKDGVEQHAMVMCSRWSPDGTYLATALGKSHTVIVYTFGGGEGGGGGIDMKPITLSVMAVIFTAFSVYLLYSAWREIRRRRP